MDNAKRHLADLGSTPGSPGKAHPLWARRHPPGFEQAPQGAALSLDVDAIIPAADLAALTEDENFWSAQEATNRKLRSHGLYITHLFPSDMVFLSREWESHVVAIPLPTTTWLQLFRPATVDLVLTKMMRGDDSQDLSDAKFLIQHDQITRPDLERAFSEVILPEIPELHEAFLRAKPHVLAMATVTNTE